MRSVELKKATPKRPLRNLEAEDLREQARINDYRRLSKETQIG